MNGKPMVYISQDGEKVTGYRFVMNCPCERAHLLTGLDFYSITCGKCGRELSPRKEN